MWQWATVALTTIMIQKSLWLPMIAKELFLHPALQQKMIRCLQVIRNPHQVLPMAMEPLLRLISQTPSILMERAAAATTTDRNSIMLRRLPQYPSLPPTTLPLPPHLPRSTFRQWRARHCILLKTPHPQKSLLKNSRLYYPLLPLLL